MAKESLQKEINWQLSDAYMVPKGKIVAIGGNEDKGSYPLPSEADSDGHVVFFEQGILKRIHDELYGIGTRIEVVTTATTIPDELYKAF